MKLFFIFLFLIKSIFFASIQISAAEINSATTAQQNHPVMFQIKTEIEIPEDFKDGADESLTLLKFSLIDESAQKEAIKEQSEQRKKECYDESCLVDTGKMLAAKGLIIVEITKKEENNYRFKATYINIETATTTKITSKYFKSNLNNFEELKNFGKSLIDDLFKATNKEVIEKEEKISTEKIDEMVEKKIKQKEEKEIEEKIKKENTLNNKVATALQIMGESGIVGFMVSLKLSKTFAFNMGGGFPFFPFFAVSFLSGSYKQSFETTLGVTNLIILESLLVPYLGFGYRYASQEKDGGIFFRIMGYLAFTSDDELPLMPWGGIDIGYSF